MRLRFAVAKKEVVARTNTIQRGHDIPVHTSWIRAPVHRLLHRCIEEKRSIRLQQANSDESSFLACAPVLLSREPARGNKDKRFHVSSLLRKLINRYVFPIIIRKSFFFRFECIILSFIFIFLFITLNYHYILYIPFSNLLYHRISIILHIYHYISIFLYVPKSIGTYIIFIPIS